MSPNLWAAFFCLLTTLIIGLIYRPPMWAATMFAVLVYWLILIESEISDG